MKLKEKWMKLKKKVKKNKPIDFLKNQSFYTNFYNLTLPKQDKLSKGTIEENLLVLEPFSPEYTLVLQESFREQFSQELIEGLLTFLKKYREFYFKKEPTWDEQYDLLQAYWILINLIKNNINVKIFNEYIIFLNENIYKKQKGFRHIN